MKFKKILTLIILSLIISSCNKSGNDKDEPVETTTIPATNQNMNLDDDKDDESDELEEASDEEVNSENYQNDNETDEDDNDEDNGD